MTELQIGLIGLGGVAVVGVVAYNTWQEYKQRKLAEQVLNMRHTDVLLDAPMSGETDTGETHTAYADAGPDGAPSLRMPSGVEDSILPTASERIEPVFRFDAEPPQPLEPLAGPGGASSTPSQPPDPGAAAIPSRVVDEAGKDGVEPVHLLSPVIDYVAAFEAVEPAPAYQILDSQRDALARIRKPIHWIGYNERSREWETVVDDGESEYRRLRIGLQLVDRRGPVDDGDLANFQLAMQDLADELMAIADLPPRQQALDSALKLDEFCASVDIQIGINVVSQGQVFLGTKLRALAEAAGMVIDSDGHFVRCDDDGNVLYVLINQEASGFSVESMKTMSTHGVTFLLDVPRIAHGERVFNQMVDLARRFADVLHGALVDDNRRPLSEGALEPIRRQVGQYQAMMAAHSLPAGGPLAQRMFS